MSKKEIDALIVNLMDRGLIYKRLILIKGELTEVYDLTPSARIYNYNIKLTD
jgi:hypothetical protein